jgi:hypothetical protein
MSWSRRGSVRGGGLLLGLPGPGLVLLDALSAVVAVVAVQLVGRWSQTTWVNRHGFFAALM